MCLLNGRKLIEGEFLTLKRKIDTQRQAFIDFGRSAMEEQEKAGMEEEKRKEVE